MLSLTDVVIIYRAAIKGGGCLRSPAEITKPPWTLVLDQAMCMSLCSRGGCVLFKIYSISPVIAGHCAPHMSYVLTPCPLRPRTSSAAIKHFITIKPGETEKHSRVECSI